MFWGMESTEPVLAVSIQRPGCWNTVTCCAQGDEGLHMLADQVQLILRQRQPLHNVFNEVIRSDSSQVPLQFTKNHQFPFLKRDKDARIERNTRKGEGVCSRAWWNSWVKVGIDRRHVITVWCGIFDECSVYLKYVWYFEFCWKWNINWWNASWLSSLLAQGILDMSELVHFSFLLFSFPLWVNVNNLKSNSQLGHRGHNHPFFFFNIHLKVTDKYEVSHSMVSTKNNMFRSIYKTNRWIGLDWTGLCSGWVWFSGNGQPISWLVDF